MSNLCLPNNDDKVYKFSDITQLVKENDSSCIYSIYSQ
jgi:hypothetical protein